MHNWFYSRLALSVYVTAMQAISAVVMPFNLVHMTIDYYLVVMLMRNVVHVNICLVLIIGFFVLEMLDHLTDK